MYTNSSPSGPYVGAGRILELTAAVMWERVLTSSFRAPPLVGAAGAAEAAQQRFRHALASLLRPQRVLELGSGHYAGAAAILAAAPRACYALAGDDEAILAQAMRNLPGGFPEADLRFIQASLNGPSKAWLAPLLAEGQFGLVIVDVSQGKAPAHEALWAAWWACCHKGFVLAEGYHAGPAAGRAVDNFLFASRAMHLYCATPCGSVLINLFKK